MDLSKEKRNTGGSTGVSALGEFFSKGDLVWLNHPNQTTHPYAQYRILAIVQTDREREDTGTLYARVSDAKDTGCPDVFWLIHLTHYDPRPQPTPIEEAPDCYGSF